MFASYIKIKFHFNHFLRHFKPPTFLFVVEISEFLSSHVFRANGHMISIEDCKLCFFSVFFLKKDYNAIAPNLNGTDSS